MKNILSAMRGWVVVGVILASSGAWGQEVCTIPGSDGNCKVSPFIGWEMRGDKYANSCKKFVKSEYQGTCTNGYLDGIALIKTKDIEGSITHYLSKFELGIPTKSILQYYSGSILVRPDLNNFSIRPSCVYFGQLTGRYKGEDYRKSSKDCLLANELLGEEFLSDETLKAINKGTFKLTETQQRSKSSNTSTQGDDPKVFGRGARGG